MRRPLLFWSFCLVALLALGYSRWPDPKGDGPPDGTHIFVTGLVCEKDETSLSIKIQNISMQNSQNANSTNLNEAAVLQQDNPNQNNFIKDFFQELNRCDKLLVSYDNAQSLILGAEVMLEGDYAVFSEATNPGEFDYARYYHSMGYLGRLWNVQVHKQVGEAGLMEALYNLRQHWKQRIYDVFPQKEASVMAAILLGEKQDVDAQIKALYQRNGIVHILSISGLHITIIGMGIYKLLRKIGMPMWAAAICGGTVLVLYGVMTGFGVSVCRAVGMYLLRMLALLWGRTYDMLTALGAVGATMALFRPAWLGHMGYLLSFGSVLGLGLLVPALLRDKEDVQEAGRPERFVEGRIRKGLIGMWRFVCSVLREGLLSGLAITLTTLPIQLWFSYEISIYSVFLNVLVLPLMSAVMITGLVAMMVPGLGVVGTVDVAILSGYEGLCYVFESLPAAIWNPGRPAVWQVVLYYLLWAVVVWVLPWMRRTVRKQQWEGAVWPWGKWIRPIQGLLLAVAVAILAIPRFWGDRITFLDVGQGDCICVRLSSGEVYLFDCGSTSRRGVGEGVLIPFLKYHGISRIDGIFVSHGDTDHTNGLVELLNMRKDNHIAIGQVVLPGIEETSLKEEFGELRDAIERADREKIPVRVIWAGEGWTAEDGTADSWIATGWAAGGGDTFLCLHPSAGRAAQGGNEGSQCFYVELHEGETTLSVLLTGDVEGAGEKELTTELKQRGIGRVDVLKVAHHGSKYSTAEEFLAVANPSLAVISCGRNNSYGHPHGETLERLLEDGAVILTTPECGAVTVEVGKSVKVRSFGMKSD